MDLSSWIMLGAAVTAGAVAAGSLGWTTRPQGQAPLPRHWPVSARGVFSSSERLLMERLREAAPGYVVLAKLPLVRLCQASDPEQQRRLYEIIGHTAVGFAVCAPNGRVLLALDLARPGRLAGRRSQRIRAGVLDACRIPHQVLAPDSLPSVETLRALIPERTGAAVAPPRGTARPAGATLAQSVRGTGGHGVPLLWSGDSFFDRHESRLDAPNGSEEPQRRADVALAASPAVEESPRRLEREDALIVAGW